MDITKHRVYSKFFDKEKTKMDDNIYIFPKEDSQKNWKKWISKESNHYMLLPYTYEAETEGTVEEKLFFEEGKRNDIKYTEMAKYIKERYKDYNENEEIIIFWQANSSIRTTFKFFLNNLEKFNSSSEEGSITIFPSEELSLIYTMGILFVVNRKKYFFTREEI